jgi:hypothetical protein
MQRLGFKRRNHTEVSIYGRLRHFCVHSEQKKLKINEKKSQCLNKKEMRV